MKIEIVFASIVLLAGVSMVSAGVTTRPSSPSTQESKVPNVLQFTMKSLGGKDVNLSQYQGKVVLIVNTASKCGNTPQYKPLEQLHEKYAGQGLAVLGFPCNQFGKQEPGTDHDISEFCTKNYGVTFDMFSKVDVNGDTACDLYKYLTSPQTDPKFAGSITWNFDKFLIARDGSIVARFGNKVKPSDPKVIAAIETELAKN